MTDTLTPFAGRTRPDDEIDGETSPSGAATSGAATAPSGASKAHGQAPGRIGAAPGAAPRVAPRVAPTSGSATRVGAEANAAAVEIEPPVRPASPGAPGQRAKGPGGKPGGGPGPKAGANAKANAAAKARANAAAKAKAKVGPAAKGAGAKGRLPAEHDQATTTIGPAAVPPTPRKAVSRPKRSMFGRITFLLVFLIPTLLVAFYYAAIAADQYRVEVRFAVRGADSAVIPGINLSALPGNTSESADSYVIADYIDSMQVIEDIRRFEDVDLRQFFSRPIVDFVHRIDPATPIAKFLDTWQWRTNVEFNSITGNTTFEVYAFTPEDARRIAALVLSQSERIVNELSRGAREALISNAQEEVTRTQERLREVSAAILDFRERNDIIDPGGSLTVETTILTQLQSELADLQTQRRALLSNNIAVNTPRVRVLDRQIRALEQQIVSQQANIGGSSGGENLAVVFGQFTDLTLEQEFARAAYTAALQSLETAEADARKQERYLATFVAPTAPDVSLHPRPLLFTLIAAFWFLILWALVVFVTRSVRDHAI